MVFQLSDSRQFDIFASHGGDMSRHMADDHFMQQGSSAVMKSLESVPQLERVQEKPSRDSDQESNRSLNSLPDVTVTSRLTSLKLGAMSDDFNGKSLLLLDGKEHLKVSAEQFLSRLGCQGSTRVKVVSVFGSTGDGKSHTLNHTFFNGDEVFTTSAAQDSCTLGVWTAFDPHLRVICLDTEGLLGSTNHEKQRTRLLLKVLAVSDVIIYRTRAERLHSDMYTFLGGASRVYTHHFQLALQTVGRKREVTEVNEPLSLLGPAVIIFHETRHTKPLQSSLTESAEDILRNQFTKLNLKMEAFSSLKYVGIQTMCLPTDFSGIRAAVQNELKNTTVRSARNPNVVYQTLKVLNDKFSGEIQDTPPDLFPDQYFTCPVKCLSCEARCDNSMGHMQENEPHTCSSRCRYQHQFENCVYICKLCHSNGQEVVVVPKTSASTDTTWFGLAKYAWSGYVLECPHCGVIYRSRQYWYGNKDPEDAAVRTEIRHVWPGASTVLQGTQNAAQKVLDGVTLLSEAVASVGSQPTRMLSSWMADQIAPKYWRPNHEIKKCFKCGMWFPSTESKHHCRACGEGFCENCSSKSMPVPDRGWDTPVRVCDICYNKVSNDRSSDDASEIDDAEVRVRKYGEAVVNTLSSVASVLEYPRGLIKDTARPTYWVPDSEIINCCVCNVKFGSRVLVHHCRDCGRGVCEDCSKGRKAVPRRGWDTPVRVCNECLKQD